jgi:hypothetical protein
MTRTVAYLSSNGVAVPVGADQIGWLEASAANQSSDAALRARLDQDGYLLLRGVLPDAAVMDVRQAYFSLFDPALCANGDVRAGVFSGIMPAGSARHGMPGHPAHAFVRSETFQQFLNRPELRCLAERLLGGAVDLVRRTPLRHFIKGHALASRAHIDGTYLNCPVSDCLTIWAPIGPCPAEAGGLAYLERSHDDPDLLRRLRAIAPTDRPDDKRPLTHDLGWLGAATGRRWLIADMAPGDLLVHRADIIHASLDPQVDLMRLSTDIRFVKQGAAQDPRWRDAWSADDGY